MILKPLTVGSRASVYVAAIVILCIAELAFVLAITFLRPTVDNTSLVATSIGSVAPVIAGLLAMTVQEVHLAVNSRLTQLLELTASASKAEGRLDSVLISNAIRKSE